MVADPPSTMVCKGGFGPTSPVQEVPIIWCPVSTSSISNGYITRPPRNDIRLERRSFSAANPGGGKRTPSCAHSVY